MDYSIYFDESNKLDQPDGEYSYYGALGAILLNMEKIIQEVKDIKQNLNTKKEMHFVEYRSDKDFEMYFRVLNIILEQDIKINLMIVNKEDAKRIANKMSISLLELRELFYVKIPERLFYGMTRRLEGGKSIQVVIDENSEYEKINLETKLIEQMNAHSAYRNKGYKVSKVTQSPSEDNIPLQLIDVLMGMVVFLLDRHYESDKSITTLIKEDLIYRILIHNDNIGKLHHKITLFKWDGESDEIDTVTLSKYTSEFLIRKTQYDVQEMNKLIAIKLAQPEQNTKYYREKMKYTNSQLRTIQGYLSELDGMGRNGHYINKD